MSQPRTRLCAYCGKLIVERKPTRRRYCKDAHKQSAYRERRRAPVVVELERVVHQHDRPGRKRDTRGDGWAIPIDDGRWQRDFDRVLWKVALSPERRAEETWQEILWQAVEDLVWALHPLRRSAEFQHIKPVVAVGFWKREYANHPELLTAVPRFYTQARAAIEAEKERKMIETVAAQNEAILARQQETLDRLERLQELAAETFARVADTAEHVRDKFPDDAEVSAAINQLLEDVGATVSEDDDLS